MSILTRYLLRLYLPAFSLCVGVFLFVLLMNYFLRLFNLAMMKGIPLIWIFSCFARLLPYFLGLVLPMAFVVALLLALGQLSESGEVLALRSAGFSFREMLAPFFLLAVSLSLLLLYVNHKASPDGFHSFRDAYSAAAAQVARVDLEPKIYFALGDWRFYAEEVGAEGEVSGVRLVKLKGRYARLRVSAPRGRTELDPGRGMRLELRGGALQWPNESPQSHTTANFGLYKLFIPFVDYAKARRDADLQELDTFDLKARLSAGGLEPSKRREFATEAALRSAGAAAPFVLFWVACPLGLRLEKRSRTVSFAMSLAVLFLFYGLLALGIGLGRRDEAFSSWSPWLPNAVSLAVGAGLWWRMVKR